MKKRNTFWILIGIGVSIVVILILLSSILSVGDRLSKISKYLEYAFYIISFVLVYILIINPVRIILFSPTFSIATVLDPDNNKKRKVIKKAGKNILKNNAIKNEDKKEIQESIKDEVQLKIALDNYFNRTLKSEITKIILKNAKTVMISTAISQNGRLDMLTVLSVNLKMVKEIVVKCGFRPSYPKLGKLAVNVFTTAMIAEGLEGLDISDLLPASTSKFLGEIPLLKPITSSVVQGISNALLTIRIGLVTRRYLFTEYKAITKESIRIEAIKESLRLLPIVIKDVISFFPKKFIGVFKKNNSEEVKFADE